jgi:SAM-dependent methyltransferase
MTHEKAVERWISSGGVGVEIGAFDTPIPGLKPFYVDRFAEYAGKPCLANFWGDACHLPFRPNSLDYVASSHVLEHVANPVAALLEWHRVLVSGGLIYMVVPDRRYTFDRNRNLSTPQHIWEDYEKNVTQCDGTHIDEFVQGADWSLYRSDIPEGGVADDKADLQSLYTNTIKNGAEINIHFHVFERENLRDLVLLVAQRMNLSWEILDCREEFPESCPNGILLIIT